MIKRTLFVGMAVAFMTTAIALTARQEAAKPQDTHIILELERSNSSLSKEGIATNQRQVLDNVRKYATSNFKVVSTYSEIANAVAISLNSEDVDLVKTVPGVKSITRNTLHWFTTYPMEEEEPSEDVKKKHYYGEDINQSAITMEKPADTYDGEGTLIAILDNEFYLKGMTDEFPKGWKHETFTELGNDVALRFKDRVTGFRSTHAYKWAQDNLVFTGEKGKEGSLYLNNKVPFYFDYGGETENYGDSYKEDLDVTSDISYHGSHVASIAAGNANYKGIAPKAQLACMKVFTNYRATTADQKIGLSSSSGAYDIPILNALEDCMTLKVDGINMSLGSNLDDFDQDSLTARTLTALAESGILTSISAGNSGKASYAFAGAYANWNTEVVETGILGSYADNAAATIVAAAQPDKVFFSSAFKVQVSEGTFTNIAYDDQIVNREHSDVHYTTEYKMEDLVKDKTEKTLEWVYVKGFGNLTDYDKLNVKGRVAITNRGSITFKEKYQNAIKKGAIAVAIINNDPTATDFNFSFSFGEDFTPTAPCVHILYKDKAVFEQQREGTFEIVSNEILDNDLKRTVSTFSTDGARFDLDLKPDITAPGENIRGAIPPQNKDDRKWYTYNTYEFLSGTSMSAPNYAGAQSVVLSKMTGPLYERGNVTTKEREAIDEYRTTVDMRLMSTAVPMLDATESPEDKEFVISSPRRQGAGMVNLTKALNTDVYLEGLDVNNQPIGKSKINLRNNNDINNGKVALSFLAHNESDEARTYKASISIMRPAIAKNNFIVTKDFNYRGEVESKEYIFGLTYYVNGEERHGSDNFAKNDAIYVSKDIEYYATAEDCANNVKTIFKQGRYYNAGDDVTVDWQPIPEKYYQSICDKVIDEVVLVENLSIPAGDNIITLPEYQLDQEAKDEIKEYFDYGCYIEGYLTLESQDDHVDLNMPYMGFYAGEGKSYESAPVAEPFAFERKDDVVYPSYLVNDLAKSLLGKDKVDFSSNWVVGYVTPGETLNTDTILSNESNLNLLTGFHQIGVDPAGEKSTDLYVGNPYYSNTMLIQQFILRSVEDNYFTIVSKKDGKEVYRSALEDMLFGASQDYKWQLYKSHVDDTYLSAGYVSHRAYAQIPLYDVNTGVPFASGEYVIQFNYKLKSTETWVSQAYTLRVDSTAPIVTSVQANKDSIRINVSESNLVGATVDRYRYDFQKAGEGRYYIDVDKKDLETYLEDNMNYVIGSGRLYVKLVDAAYGVTGVIIRFADDGENYIYNAYTMVQYHSLTLQNDFLDDGENITIVKYNSATDENIEVKIDDYVRINRGISVEGCSGNIWTTSLVLSSLALAGIVFLIVAKAMRKKVSEGGK